MRRFYLQKCQKGLPLKETVHRQSIKYPEYAAECPFSRAIHILAKEQGCIMLFYNLGKLKFKLSLVYTELKTAMMHFL